MYKQGQGKPKWKTLKRSNAKIQAQVSTKREKVKVVTKELKMLLECKV